VRHFSLIAAQGIYPGDSEGFNFVGNFIRKAGYLEKTYFPVIYPVHSVEPRGLNTIHPISAGTVDEIKNINYYQLERKINTKMMLFSDRCKSQINI